jgi:chemotaxis protein histidine kinase CheA
VITVLLNGIQAISPGGSIDMQSAPEQGTQVVLRLPMTSVPYA